PLLNNTEGAIPMARTKSATAKKAAPATKKAASSSAVTLRHLAATIAEDHELPRKAAEGFLGDTVALIVKHLKKGDRIRIVGLGILQVRKRAARLGRNPAT